MPLLLIRLEDHLSKLLLALIVVLVFAAGVARTLGMPLVWSVDLAQLMFIWLCFLGANRALRLKAHIGVDFFVRKVPFGQRRIVEIALGLMVLGFLAVLAWTGVKLTVLNWERVFGDSGLSYAWVTAAVPVGAGLLAVTLVAHLARAVRDRSLVFAADPDLDRSSTQLG